MQSTSVFASLFEHLNTTTGVESLLFGWFVVVTNCRSTRRYINISLSVSGASACTHVGSTSSSGIVSAIT